MDYRLPRLGRATKKTGLVVVLALGGGCAAWGDLGGTASVAVDGADASTPAPSSTPGSTPSPQGTGDAAPPPADAGGLGRSGILDPTFGATGYVTSMHPTAAQDRANAVTVDAHGRVVVGGTTQSQATHATVWRLMGDGSFDATFGTEGAWMSTTPMMAGGLLIDAVYGVFVDGQDRPVLGGQAPSSTAAQRSTAWRLTTGGVLDPSFGGTGEVHADASGAGTGPNDWSYGIAKGAQGELVLSGSAMASPAGNAEAAVWRMTADGTPDTSFGSPNGYVVEWGDVDGGIPANDVGLSTAVDRDGKIVVAGDAQDDQSVLSAAIWRFTSTGAVDTTFQGTGRVGFSQIAGPSDSPDDEALGVAIDAQNGIIFAGTSVVQTSEPAPFGSRAFVGRLLPSGALDTSFGSGGFALLEPPPGGLHTSAFALAIDSQGRVVVAGESGDADGIGVAAWRLSPSGALDTTYGNAGMFAMVRAPGASDHAFAVALDPTDRAVLAGYGDRTNADGSLDRSMVVWRLTP